ncbi:MAG: aldehyde:ferredoxin oxidoreductase [Peptococcaceae bacterium BICA1-8]|nr:MAG: aldehyde:ferredoxin oxidoreductase [Peptococcaceae bacterium BICA1-8]
MERIIRINMNNLQASQEMVKEEHKMLGGRALTSKLALEEIPPECEPLGKENKLIFAVGLLAGTAVSSSGRLSVGGKSPLTGGIKESNSGGITSQKLCQLGVRALIIEGKPKENILYILHMSGEKIDLIEAKELKGLGTYDTVEKLRARFGKEVAISLIGQPGEKKMAVAGIVNIDLDGAPARLNARGGLGAVFGSKGIKAVVIDARENKCQKPIDKYLFTKANKRVLELIKDTTMTSEIYPRYGTSAIVELASQLNCLPTLNFSHGQFEHADKINADALFQLITKRGGKGKTTHGCMPGCVIRCSNIFPKEDGEVLVPSLEYETIALLGSNLGIASFDTIAEINRLCNDYGIDTIEVGAAIGVAMEAGIVSFGDGDGAIRLVKEINSGSVIGRLIGSGSVITGRVLGVQRVPAVKGQAMAGYDPRGLKGLGVTYATSPMGADHTAGQTSRASVDHKSSKGQVEVSRNAQINAVIYDSLGLCLMVGAAFSREPQLLVDLINARFGNNWSMESLQEMAKEVLRNERDFNLLAGFTSNDDRLPHFFQNELLPEANTIFDVVNEELGGIWRNF